MSRKRPRVPETRVTSPNREERRHPGRAEDAAVTRDDARRDLLRPDEESPPKRQRILRDGPQDVSSTRAKSSGHGKKTADKWNQ